MIPIKDAFAFELLDMFPISIIMLNGLETICFINKEGCRLLEADKSQIIGASYKNFLPHREAALLRSGLSRIRNEGQLLDEVVHRFNKPDRTSLVLQTRMSTFSTENIPDGYLVVSRDITKRSESLNRLKLMTRAIEQLDESVVVTNREGIIEYVNTAFEEITGYGKEEAIGKTPSILKSGMHKEEFYEKMWQIILSGNSFHNVIINKKKDGSIYYEDKTITPVKNDDGIILHHVATGRDVTFRKQAEEKLMEGMERFSLSMQGTNDGLWDWDFRSGEIFFSRRWKEMLGYRSEEIGHIADDWFKLVHPDDIGELKTHIRSHVAGETQHLEYEYRIKHKDGGYLWVFVRGLAVRTPGGKTYRMAGFQSDITNRKMVEEQLHHDALHDALTGLPNRMLFLDRLTLAIERAKRNPDYKFSVCFMDLDRFKIINDSMGHHAGDQMLIETGNRIKSCLRSSDTLARLGGDEFALLLEGVYGKKECTEFAERILAELRKPYNILKREVYSSASMGITSYRPEYSKSAEVLRDADAAMYRAKKMGRNRIAHFDQAMHTEAVSLLEMETDLSRALEDEKFLLHYQPIVRLSSGDIWGFECFLRWRHPDRGWVPPMDFIPAAEQHGMIHQLSDLVFRHAGKHLGTLRNVQSVGNSALLSVNLSSSQFIQPDLVVALLSKMRRYDIPPNEIKLEVKESILSEYPVQAENLMKELKKEKISVILDDFGTGMSSLSNLKRYPIEKVKIDESFISTICSNRDSHDIVKSAITMAHSLNIGVIAECVEKKEQAECLKSLGCDHAQGFYFSKPLDSNACIELALSKKHWAVS